MTTDPVRKLLADLYGEAGASSIRPHLDQLLSLHRAQHPPPTSPRGALRFTGRDVLLITYADQVSEPGLPPLLSLASLAHRQLRGLVSGIHLLPFYPWSSDDGFAVKDLFAVDPAYGTWDDVARLGRDFDLMMDGVFNHLSAESDWFRRYLANDPEFANFFVSVDGSPDLSAVIRPRALPLLTEFPAADGPRKVWTTFSADQVDLDVRHPEVLLALIEAMLAYVSQGARYLRLDAIAFLWKEIGTSCLHHAQTHRVIQLMRAVLDEVAPDVMLITETNVPHVDNVSYFGDGTNEAQLVYNFALPPLVLHSLQTGNAARLTRWAAALALPSDQVTFFNFLASHDGIGLNPARGILADAEIEAMVARTLERGGFISNKSLPDGSEIPYEMNINYLDALSDPSRNEPATLLTRRFLTAQAIMLSLQGVPGIYFHSLFGSRGDRAGAESSGIKRRINRQKLDRTQLEAELAMTTSLRHEVFSGYRRLLALRAAHTAFAPSASQQILDLDDRVFAVRRASPENGDQALCVHNVSGDTVRCELPLPAGVDRWHDLDDQPANGLTGIQLEPWASRWLGA